MSQDDATAGLLHALVDTAAGPVVDDDWASMAMVLEFPDGGFNSAHGYLYSSDGTVSPVACDPWVVGAAVSAYTASHYGPGERLPLKILVQLDGQRAGTASRSRTPTRPGGR